MLLAAVAKCFFRETLFRLFVALFRALDLAPFCLKNTDNLDAVAGFCHVIIIIIDVVVLIFPFFFPFFFLFFFPFFFPFCFLFFFPFFFPFWFLFFFLFFFPFFFPFTPLAGPGTGPGACGPPATCSKEVTESVVRYTLCCPNFYLAEL